MPVSAAIRWWKRRSQSFQPARSPSTGRLLHGGQQRLGLVVGPAALGGQPGDGRLEQLARLEQVGRAGVVRVARAAGGAGRHERAGPGPRLDHARDLQRRDRLADRGAADLQPAREVAL